MSKRRVGDPNVYLVTVERERVVKEVRTVRVVAYTADAAKMIAKQKRPSEGWEYAPVAKNLNSGSTTTFGPSKVELVGPAPELPEDAQERHSLLNDSRFVVKVAGEY